MAALDFKNATSGNNFGMSSRLEKFRVSSLHGMHARVFSSHLTHLLLKAQLHTVRESFAFTLDLNWTTCETKFGFAKSMAFLSWSMGGSETALIGCANSATRSAMFGAGGRHSQAVRNQGRRDWCPPICTGEPDHLWHLDDAARSSSPTPCTWSILLALLSTPPMSTSCHASRWVAPSCNQRAVDFGASNWTMCFRRSWRLSWCEAKTFLEASRLLLMTAIVGRITSRSSLLICCTCAMGRVHFVCQHARFLHKNNARQCVLRHMVRNDPLASTDPDACS